MCAAQYEGRRGGRRIKHRNRAKRRDHVQVKDRQSEIREEDAAEAYEEMEVVETRNANVRF